MQWDHQALPDGLLELCGHTTRPYLCFFSTVKKHHFHEDKVKLTRAQMMNNLETMSSVQGVGEAWNGAVIPLWEPCAKIWAWEDHREHDAVPGSCRLLHGGRAPGETL